MARVVNALGVKDFSGFIIHEEGRTELSNKKKLTSYISPSAAVISIGMLYTAVCNAGLSYRSYKYLSKRLSSSINKLSDFYEINQFNQNYLTQCPSNIKFSLFCRESRFSPNHFCPNTKHDFLPYPPLRRATLVVNLNCHCHTIHIKTVGSAVDEFDTRVVRKYKTLSAQCHSTAALTKHPQPQRVSQRSPITEYNNLQKLLQKVQAKLKQIDPTIAKTDYMQHLEQSKVLASITVSLIHSGLQETQSGYLPNKTETLDEGALSVEQKKILAKYSPLLKHTLKRLREAITHTSTTNSATVS